MPYRVEKHEVWCTRRNEETFEAIYELTALIDKDGNVLESDPKQNWLHHPTKVYCSECGAKADFTTE